MVLMHRVVLRGLVWSCVVSQWSFESSLVIVRDWFTAHPRPWRGSLPISAHTGAVYKAAFHCDDNFLLLPSFSSLTLVSDLSSSNLLLVSSISSEQLTHPSTSCLQPHLLRPAVSSASLHSVNHSCCRRYLCGRVILMVLSDSDLS
jgi:hypothetical protein